MNRFNIHSFALMLLLAGGVLSSTAHTASGADSATESPANGQRFKPAEYNLGADKVAISGYDPVAYSTLHKALKGRQDLSATHRGVTYYFANEEHRKLFTASPDKYLPAYGGWCATAMAKGKKVEIDPTNFKVTNGRLFLFFKAFYANAITDWNKDESNLTAKANANWKTISGE